MSILFDATVLAAPTGPDPYDRVLPKYFMSDIRDIFTEHGIFSTDHALMQRFEDFPMLERLDYHSDIHTMQHSMIRRLARILIDWTDEQKRTEARELLERLATSILKAVNAREAWAHPALTVLTELRAYLEKHGPIVAQNLALESAGAFSSSSTSGTVCPKCGPSCKCTPEKNCGHPDCHAVKEAARLKLQQQQHLEKMIAEVVNQEREAVEL